ncbi:hypothetical protein M407DRAFT_131915 [Tulasnella calospora MUT 4182]|uniref:VWFA domain-containing protein n=1 Tax=Tulasnella calospora MUT 4182 TaxID=1051891 RepID=A0A0C3QAA5_9AGAM|nr:hypothetical protein M407DRAFT_131915 [Tulasnella calospora MUT 4182]
MGLFGRISKPSSSKAAKFPYNSTLDQSLAAQQAPASEKRNPGDGLGDGNPFDPPPEYSPTDAPKREWPKPIHDGPVADTDLDVLRNYDTVFIVDDSGSMLQDDSDSDRSSKGKAKQRERTRWDKARDALEAVATMATQHDGNGVDIYFLNSEDFQKNCRNERDVMDLFNRVTPRGKTPTGHVLKNIITPYIDSLLPWPEKASEKSLPKPRNYIVITDGRPTDPEGSRLRDVILEFARRLDEGGVPLTQLGIQFLQVGDADDASEALKELDGDLHRRVKNREIRDIVDTIPFEELQGDISESHIIKVLVGSINKRIDKTHHLDM